MNRLITLSALALGGSGALALYQPEKAAELHGFKADTPEQRHEVRAIGGASVAMAAMLLVRPSSAGAVAMVLAGTAAGRATSATSMEGSEPSQQVKTAIGIEGGLAAALFLGRTQLAASRAASAIADKVTS